MLVTVTDQQGCEYSLHVSAGDNVDELKERVLGPDAEGKAFRLVSVRSGRALEGSGSLEEQGVLDEDALVLIQCRLVDLTPPDPTVEPSPDGALINLATAQLTKHVRAKEAVNIPVIDFDGEMHRILISLIEAASLQQSLNDDTSSDEEEPPAEHEGHKVDPTALKQLQDMGFPENRAVKALLLNDMKPMPAMDWLFLHENDPTIDEPLPLTPSRPQPQAAPSTSGRRRKGRQFVPSQRAIYNLKDMGFTEQEIIDALRVTGNDQEAACEWLLAENKPDATSLDEGLDKDGALYKAIFSQPFVQQGLHNRRVLAALEELLEHPQLLTYYLTDSETGPILLHITNIVQGHFES